MSEVILDDIKPIDELDDAELFLKIDACASGYFNSFRSNLESAYEDAAFSLGRQWEAYEEADFAVRNRVCLTINLLNSFILNVIGQYRQNTPQIKVRALDDNTKQKEINFVESILRHISYDSDSDLSYQVGLENSLRGGFGAWRVAIDYDGTASFNKKAMIIPVPDIKKVYFDPDALHPTKKDGRYCGIYTKMSKEEFHASFPKEDFPTSVTIPSAYPVDVNFSWTNPDGIIIVEHFHKVWKKTKIHKLNTGEVVKDKDLDERLRELRKVRKIYEERLSMIYRNMVASGAPAEPPPPIPEIKVEESRYTDIPTIYHYKAIKDKILERGIFPGEKLPLIFVDGNSNWINGKQETVSFIRYSKDPQKFFNMLLSDLATMSKMGHKGEYLVTEAMVNDYKEIWRNPEKYGNAKFYKPDPTAPDGRPVYNPPAELPSSLVAQTQNLYQMIQQTLGRFEANRGEPGNEQSGKAIISRGKQGDSSVFIFMDNVNKAIEETNKLIVDIIPEIYGKRDIVSARSKDGNVENVRLSDEFKDTLNNKKFDVSVSIGAPFELQKDEQLQLLVSIAQTMPNLLPAEVVGDLLVSNLNLDITPQLVERIKNNVVNPNVLKVEKGEQPDPPAPDPMQQMIETDIKAKEADIKLKEMKLMQDKRISDDKITSDLLKAELDYRAKVDANAANQEKNIADFIGKHLDRSVNTNSNEELF